MRRRRRGCTCNPRNPWDPCKACEAAADRLEYERDEARTADFDPDGRMADAAADRYERWMEA